VLGELIKHYCVTNCLLLLLLLLMMMRVWFLNNEYRIWQLLLLLLQKV
jgi:hypothetical protein